jgi:gamma-glutamylputrescine oxidase
LNLKKEINNSALPFSKETPLLSVRPRVMPAFACFGSPTELLHNIETLGTDGMLEVVEMRYKGIEKIKQHFADEVIAFDPCGGYECINKNYRHWEMLDDKIHWLNDLLTNITGKKNIFQRIDKKLTGLGLQNFDALIENVTEAALHSGKLVQALTQKVQSAGVSILYGMEVSGWEKTNAMFISIQNNKLICLPGRFCSAQMDLHRISFRLYL